MPHPIFRAAGSLDATYAGVEWAESPLGSPDTWSPSLVSTVALMLRSRFPITLMWGPELVLVYNEAYVQLIGAKHPAALGRPAREVFDEAWDLIGPMLTAARDDGVATWLENEQVPLVRNGFLEDCYFTFSYSPVLGEDGAVAGVIDIAAETTTQVVSQRRLETLGRLRDRLTGAEEVHDVPRLVLEALAPDRGDLAVVDLRLDGEPGAVAPSSAPSEALDERDLWIEATEDGPLAWLRLSSGRASLTRSGHGTLAVTLNPRLAVDRSYREFLRLVAATIAQALDRVVVRDAERRAARAERDFSESLQHSLLTVPAQQAGLEIAVRYQPAAQEARVGGDWHDAFHLPDGSLGLTIGDVAGHDREAAAGMAQVRNLLRGIAHTLPQQPHRVLAALDHALLGLAVDTIATAVFARIEAPTVPGGSWRLRWSNAGHPPPVVVGPGRPAHLLAREPELLLGFLPGRPRTSHVVDVPPGTTLVLYTDGLVERRGSSIEDGLGSLVETVDRHAADDIESLCDRLLALATEEAEDDVALLVLRVTGSTRVLRP